MTQLAVYSGRVRLGTIREHDHGEHEAIGLDDVPLGRFPTRSEAIAALPGPSEACGIWQASLAAPSRPARGLFHGLGR